MYNYVGVMEWRVFMVIQGHRFRYQLKARRRLPVRK